MRILISLALLILPLLANAEIADKVASYPSMWGVSIATSLVLAVLCYWKPVFVLLGAVVSAILAGSYVDMASDDHFRQLVETEMGSGYLASGFLSAGLVLIVSATAAFLRKRSQVTPGD